MTGDIFDNYMGEATHKSGVEWIARVGPIIKAYCQCPSQEEQETIAALERKLTGTHQVSK